MKLTIIRLYLRLKKRESGYCLPPNEPKIANKAKNNATGKIPITVHAVSFAFSHSVVPKSASEVTVEFHTLVGQSIASETSEKISMPINKATAAPINARINPSDSI